MINNILEKIKLFRKEKLNNKTLVLISFVGLFFVVSFLDQYKREEDKKIKKKEEIAECVGFLTDQQFLDCKKEKNKNKKDGKYSYFYFKEGVLTKYEGESKHGLARVELENLGPNFSCVSDQPTGGDDTHIILDKDNIKAVCFYDDRKKALVIYQDQNKNYKQIFKELWGGDINDKGEVSQ